VNKENSQNTPNKDGDSGWSTNASGSVSTTPPVHPDLQLAKIESRASSGSRDTPRQADWAVVLDAATKRRTQILEPENLDNMWTKGRHYQKKLAKISRPPSEVGPTGKDLTANFKESIDTIDDKYMVNMMHASTISYPNNKEDMARSSIEVSEKEKIPMKGHIKRSTSSPDMNTAFNSKSGEGQMVLKNGPDSKGGNSVGGSHSEGSLHVPKIRCRVSLLYYFCCFWVFIIFIIVTTDLVCYQIMAHGTSRLHVRMIGKFHMLVNYLILNVNLIIWERSGLIKWQKEQILKT
jgi:hypothetical protein